MFLHLRPFLFGKNLLEGFDHAVDARVDAAGHDQIVLGIEVNAGKIIADEKANGFIDNAELLKDNEFEGLKKLDLKGPKNNRNRNNYP